MKKEVKLAVPAIALVLLGGFALGVSHIQKAHAQTQTDQIQTEVKRSDHTDVNDTPKTAGQKNSSETSTKEAENDSPNGHQDPQGVNTDHQFEGIE